MNRVVHFEIQADDPERCCKFYRDVFGWEISKWNDPKMEYWVVMTAPKDSKDLGINGGILRRPAKTPPQQQGTNAFVCTIDVPNFDETAKKILVAGGIEAMPKFEIAGMALQGYFLDSEGNTFGLHQLLKKA